VPHLRADLLGPIFEFWMDTLFGAMRRDVGTKRRPTD
jgi:hypothetical protein